MTHKSVELTRKLPPVYDLHGKSVVVTIAPSQRSGQTNTELQSAIEKLLTASDSSVRVESQSADLSITGQITNYEAPHVVTTTQDKTTIQTMFAGMNVAFRIMETRGGHLVASAVATSQVDQQMGVSAKLFGIPTGNKGGDKGIKSTIDAQNMMVAEVGRQIASFLVITPEGVPVQLAVASNFKEANRLAEARLWARDLEQLATLTPYPDPKYDAYRLYNIGVANEALAYEAQDQERAVKYLNEASIDYGKATAAKPDEKYFLQPQNRIASALEHYGVKSTSSPAASSGGRGVEMPSGPAAAEVLTDDDVIDMVKAKVEDPVIIDTILSAPKVNFDLTPKGLVRLSTGGVRGKVMDAVRQKAKSTAPVK